MDDESISDVTEVVMTFRKPAVTRFKNCAVDLEQVAFADEFTVVLNDGTRLESMIPGAYLDLLAVIGSDK